MNKLHRYIPFLTTVLLFGAVVAPLIIVTLAVRAELLHRLYQPPKVICTSVAPDRTRALTITEMEPQAGMSSPYTYKFALTDGDGKSFTGRTLEFGNDSASLPANNFNVKWQDGVAIVDVDGKAAFRIREENRSQTWERYEVAPTVTPKPSAIPEISELPHSFEMEH